MDSKVVNDVTGSSNSDLYNESLDWIRSINHQMKSPGNFISSRLESVSLEQLQREFSSLLLTSQSHGSSLLRTLFSNATSHNDNLKKIIMTLWPIKDKVSGSYDFLKSVRDDNLHISNSVNKLLNRLNLVKYAKLAISTVLQANENLNNLCDEIVYTFSPLNNNEVGSKYGSKLTTAVGLIEQIYKNSYRMNTLIQNLSSDYNLESNWLLLEFAPKELTKIRDMLEKYKLYDLKLGELLQLVYENKSYLDGSNYNNESNLHLIISMECGLDSVRSDRLSSEFSVSKFENDIQSLTRSLCQLVELCANISFTRLYKLYSEYESLDKNGILTNDDSVQKDKVRDEMNKYLTALVSIIKGHKQLNSDDLSLLVSTFNECFLSPFLESNPLFSSGDKGSKSFFSLHDESNNFSSFVDSFETQVLNPQNSVLLLFLNDLSQLLGDEEFKSLCILGPLARSIFAFVEESYSSIFTPIYPEYYSQNYKAFEHLLTLLETFADSSSKHLFKWRGTPLPYNFATRFCTGVICDNFIENVCSVVHSELEKHHELDGNFLKFDNRAFYLQSTLVVYKQAKELFAENEFFYHLFPQYLKGFGEIIKAYVNHVDSFITHMESTNNESAQFPKPLLWSTGLSFAFSSYVLHDVVELLDSLTTSDVNLSEFHASSSTVSLKGLGGLSKTMFTAVQRPIHLLLERTKMCNNGHDLELLWKRCIEGDLEKERLKEVNEPFLKDTQGLFFFIIRVMNLVSHYLDNCRENLDFIKDKLEQYIVSSLYNSSKCSLQFIQSLSSKYRTSNKQDSNHVSDYVKFLVAPLVSFYEFSQDITRQDLLKNLMTKTIQLVSSDYINYISKLLSSVESLNSSLMNPKNISLSEYSDSFLIVDIHLLKSQLSRDIGEFYDVCVKEFGINKKECTSLEQLLEFRT